MEGIGNIGRSKANISKRLQKIEDKLDDHQSRESRTVVSPETVHALDALVQIRREGMWNPHDPEAWSWRTRQGLEDHLRDRLLAKAVDPGLAQSMAADIATSAFDKLAAQGAPTAPFGRPKRPGAGRPRSSQVLSALHEVKHAGDQRSGHYERITRAEAERRANAYAWSRVEKFLPIDYSADH